MMMINKTRTFWIAAILCGGLFLALFSIRVGFFNSTTTEKPIASLASFNNFSDRNTWMNIFQNGEKIGFSHSRYARIENGYHFNESVFMRINTMGMIQNISLKTNGTLARDFSLKSFDFKITSGRFNFSAAGTISDKVLSLITKSAESENEIKLPLSDNIYFTSGIVQAASSGNLNTGDHLSLKIFDPVAMGQEPIQLTVLGPEEIRSMGGMTTAVKLALKYKGATQYAWVDGQGDILKEEGMLGIALEKTTREDAIYGLPIQSSQDFTKAASIPSNIDIRNPAALNRLEAEVRGVGDKARFLDGGRQTYQDPILVIRKESLDDLSAKVPAASFSEAVTAFLEPSPFIQSDNPSIRKLASDIVAENESPIEKARKIVAWIQEHIEKRPVLSLPDALSTLENRVGDCNEHAVLFAALARAAGLPSKVEAGVVYLKNRFYYHAWNSIYVGRWITVDSLFNQIPADVTHIRLVSGTQREQLDILGLIGKLNIHILDGSE